MLSLFGIVFSVWLLFTLTGYGAKYARQADGWRIGGVRPIEITLVQEEVKNLGCASEVVVGGLTVAFATTGIPSPRVRRMTT